MMLPGVWGLIIPCLAAFLATIRTLMRGATRLWLASESGRLSLDVNSPSPPCPLFFTTVIAIAGRLHY